MSTHSISIRELRPRLASVLDLIASRFERYVVTKRGKPEAIILSVDDYASLVETLDIESDKPLMRQIRAAEVARRKGKGKNLDALRKELKIV